MSGSDPEQTYDVYTMPPEAYRVGNQVPREPDRPSPVTPEPRPEPPQRRVRRRKGWDIALSILLLLVLLGVALLGSYGTILLAFAVASCGDGGRVCQGDLRDLGIWISFTAPWMVAVLTTVVTVVLLVRRRRGFWAPLGGLVLAALVWGIGAFLVWAAV